MITLVSGPLKGVLFDFDGTLTIPGALDFQAIKREIRCPEEMAILEYLASLPPESRKRSLEILERREEAAAAVSRPNAGAEECILGLRSRGIHVGILTRNSLSSVLLALDNFQYVSSRDFTVILTRDTALPKPDPDGVLKAAEAMGITPGELLVVGDFRFDVMAGHAAGARTALLTNGAPSSLRPGDPRPDHAIAHLGQVLPIVLLHGRV
ncbi:MAG: HAD family hydrolase [Deltaproteobacteria bacterium]|nr:HAD family hydrolase [Deltaproteobacteria bacterium]MBW1924132.1 HAD family hydrolase [Deltaproteobacteria bacterium]MBW1950073.1 HAD family hydrolase [Deltaproteobacteria bacterium]MBW2009329.1 HAD family hydrolase [Deltaproteobacteria bacterium]MBW2102253.1 HAD family hydrolase [Deltaproteobacteria bacterium]